MTCRRTNNTLFRRGPFPLSETVRPIAPVHPRQHDQQPPRLPGLPSETVHPIATPQQKEPPTARPPGDKEKIVAPAFQQANRSGGGVLDAPMRPLQRILGPHYGVREFYDELNPPSTSQSPPGRPSTSQSTRPKHPQPRRCLLKFTLSLSVSPLSRSRPPPHKNSPQ